MIRVVPDDCRPCVFDHEPGADPACVACQRFLADPRYAQKWRTCDPGIAGPPPPPPPPASGPGTELEALLARLGVQAGNCNCKAHVVTMNAWGVEGSREHRDQIVGWLREEREKRGWGETFAAGLKAVLTGLAFRLDPLDPLGSLVDEAIRRAEKVD